MFELVLLHAFSLVPNSSCESVHGVHWDKVQEIIKKLLKTYLKFETSES